MAADCKSAVLWDYEGSNPSLCTSRLRYFGRGFGMPSGLGRERKFWIALGLYGILAVVIWFTLGEGTVLVLGRRVEIRWVPLFVIATFAFRTYIAREAEKIRRGSEDGS